MNCFPFNFINNWKKKKLLESHFAPEIIHSIFMLFITYHLFCCYVIICLILSCLINGSQALTVIRFHMGTNTYMEVRLKVFKSIAYRQIFDVTTIRLSRFYGSNEPIFAWFFICATKCNIKTGGKLSGA